MPAQLRQEDLNEALRPRIIRGGLLRWLVYDTYYSPEWNAQYNKDYKAKLVELRRRLHDHDYNHVITLLCEKPYRIQAFERFAKRLNDSDYWNTLREVWEMSENIWQNRALWIRMLRSERPNRDSFMTDEEQRFLKSKPAKFVVYRGRSCKHRGSGVSWTLSREKAEWFAARYGLPGRVLIRRVRKSEVFAYLDGRQEQEIILLPSTRKPAARRS